MRKKHSWDLSKNTERHNPIIICPIEKISAEISVRRIFFSCIGQYILVEIRFGMFLFRFEGFIGVLVGLFYLFVFVCLFLFGLFVFVVLLGGLFLLFGTDSYRFHGFIWLIGFRFYRVVYMICGYVVCKSFLRFQMNRNRYAAE